MRRIGIAIVGALLVIGCGPPPAKNNGGTNNTNGTTNGETNGSTNGGTGPIVDVEFVLENVSDSSVFVGARPVQIYEGDEVVNTDIYPCACGMACPAVEPASLQEMRPGETMQWVWSGAIDTGGECSTEGVVGRPFEAEICYGRNFRGETMFDGEPTDVECERVEFELTTCPTGPGGGACAHIETVEAENDVQPVEPPVELAIENATGEPIYLQEALNCSVHQWYQLLHAGEPLQTSQPCGPCDCAEGPECGIGCNDACAQDEVTEIEPGGAHSVELAGTYFRYYDEDGYECTQQQYLPDPITAELCYGTEVVSEEVDSEIVANTTCETVQFTLEDRGARLVVQ